MRCWYHHTRESRKIDLLLDEAILAGKIRPYRGQDGLRRLFVDADGKIQGALPRVRAVTICTIEDGDGGKAIGFAFCSQQDNFSKSRGRMIAEGRARKILQRNRL